ncbi:hypothetical protein MOD24_14965 [Bacillus haynesii]|uniref:hypothetical protein n=1 Tax=Bacillus haynesii TaxID=1925021 RepID=UPI00227EFC36|nr:hypothetical protein [Bacillus haynesii]MCY8577149.1 hypothetical protein [Bacillus haynesii]MEC1657153.1 hypothetical protein [Bacillus haynesii]
MNYTLEEHKNKQLIKNSDLTESVGIIGKIKPETVEKLTEAAKGKNKRKLVVQMEAIHVGRTANYTFYTEEGLKNGLESWTHPYNKPVLTHHDSHSGEPIGRILRAEFAESTMSGRKGLIFTCEITDPEAIEKVLDGRYQTVSIGATTDRVTCNICGTDRTKEWCEHWRGEEYEGQTCHFVIGTTFGNEVSYVNVPADENAGNFSVSVEDSDDSSTEESATLQIFQIAEGLMQDISMPHVNLYESVSEDLKQLIDGLLEQNEGGTQDMTKPTQQENVSVEELQNKLDLSEQKVKSLEGKLAETQETLSNLVIEKSKVDSLLSESQAEVTRLTSENANLIEKNHKSLAEKVVDMKLALRKSDVVGMEREEAVAEHIKRTEESLNDAVKDLQIEMKDTSAQKGSVTNPGFSGEDNNPNKKNEEKDKEGKSIEEAASIFSSMFGRKKR